MSKFEGPKVQDAREAAQKNADEFGNERESESSPDVVRQEQVAPSDEYLTTLEVAHRTRMSTSFFEKMRCAGGGPRYRKCGSSVRYRWLDVVSFMEGRQRGSTSDPGEDPDGGEGA